MVLIIILFFVSTNVMAGYYIVKSLNAKKRSYVDYISILMALVINMALLSFYVNFVKIRIGVDYLLFIIPTIGGLYGLVKAAGHILRETHKLERKITKQDVAKIKIKENEAVLGIFVYAISFIAIVAFYARNH